MKKIFALALAAAAVFSVQAQDVKEMYESAKKLDDAFNKAKPTQMSPDRQVDAPTAKGLLDAIQQYEHIMKLEAESGAKPKFTKKIMDSMKKHAEAADFNVAAVALFNGGLQYPEAYTAFMLSGESSKEMQVPDSIYAIDFFNAGNSAYGRDFEAAAKAYDAAISANISDPQAFVYAIGARQNLMSQKPEAADKARKEIHDVAKIGVDKFGYNQDFIFNNYLQYFFDTEDFDSALAELAKAEAADASNANVYRLRGIISNAKHDYLASVPAFEKMSELTDKYDYLLKAAADLNSVGKAIMGNIANPTPEDKAQILHIFDSALKIANKAKTAPDADSRVSNEIEDIEYNIENANKL